MRPILLLGLVLMSIVAVAVERKPLNDVDSNALTKETQTVAPGEGFHFVWWIPTEFWEVVMLQDETVTAEGIEETLRVLRPYSTLAVIKADISAFGAFRFYERDQVRDVLRVSYSRPGEETRALALIEDIDPDLEILLGQMKPILASAMGNAGQSFHFFTLSDNDGQGRRLVSPYKTGKLIVEFVGENDSTPPQVGIETPLDSLFIPRICPNGKPAHVSWKVCPWDGTVLEE